MFSHDVLANGPMAGVSFEVKPNLRAQQRRSALACYRARQPFSSRLEILWNSNTISACAAMVSNQRPPFTLSAPTQVGLIDGLGMNQPD